MPKLDPLSAQIVTLVRSMPDEALLELVRNQLNLGTAQTPAASFRPAKPLAAVRAVRAVVAASAPAKKGAPKGKRRVGRQSSEARKQLRSTVERTVKSSKGLSASEVAKKVKAPQSRVAALLRDLKHSKRIFQGGDRRYARYAGDVRTAKQASLTARQASKKS